MADGAETWTVWLDKHGAALVAYARQWSNNHADAEDIVQEAFVRFWRSHNNVRNPAAYLFASVKRGAVDWHRKAQRRARREKDLAQQHARTEQTIFNTTPAEHAETQAAIEAAIQRLPLPQREVLILKIWGELTFDQVAEVTEVPSNTASSRYRYALDALRKDLGRERSK
jgi:RNA polymerase sigma-70 factor (ECF subfamily)